MPRDLTPEEIAAQYGNAYVADAPHAGDLTRLGTAWGDRVPAGLYGIGEAMGLPLRDQRLANQFENEETMRRFYQTNPNEPQSYKDIGSIGDAGRYAKGLLIDSSPELVTGLATGGVAGGVYGLGGLGRTVAGAAANAPSALGDILQNQREAGGRTDLASAALLTIPYAAADMVGLEGAVARGSMMRTGLKRLDDMQGLKGVAARTSANVAMNAPIEGGSETFQEMVNQAARTGVNPSERMFSPEALDRYGESFVGGAVLGGGVSGAMGGWRRSEGYQAPQAPQQETNLLTPTQPAAPEPRVQGLVAQPVSVQQRINESLGIGRKPVAGKKYASQFEAAFNEPTGQYVQDPETGIERPLTVGEMMQRGMAPMDLTVANPAATAAAATVVNNVATTRDPQDVLLRDTLNVIPNQHSRALLTAMAESGIDPQSKVAEAAWNYAGQKYMTPARLTKALAILDESIIEARKGTSNVSTTPTTVSTITTGLGTGGTVVQGGLGTTGSSPTGNIQPSTGSTGTGTTTGQTQSAPTTGGQQTTTVTEGLTDGSQAPKTQQTKTQGQTTTTRGAAGTTPLVDTSDDALEIARATGNAAEIEALREDALYGEGTAEKVALTADDVEKIVAASLAKSKNASRDAKILNAYLTALRASPNVDKAAIQNAIGDKYGLEAVTVRKIGNPAKLIAAGDELGFSAEQVMELFAFDDNTKAQFTAIGKLESQITGLRKQYKKAKPGAARNAIADKMAGLSEQIAKLKEKASSDKADAFSAGLQEAGVSGAEGESAGFGFDTEREWSRLDGSSKAATSLVNYMNAIDELRPLVDEYVRQGQTEAAQNAQDQIERMQAQVTALLQAVTPETKPATKAAPDVAEARQRWNDAGRDLTKLSTEDLQVLKTYTASINNKALSDKIAAEISSRGTTQEATNAVQVESPTSVSVQPKTEAGQGVGEEVRGTEKPASKGEVAVLTPQEQYEKVTAGFPVPAWTDLTQSQQGKLSDLARRDQLNLAAVNRFVAAEFQNIERFQTTPAFADGVRTPSLSRGLTALRQKLNSGEITTDAFAARVELLHNSVLTTKQSKPAAPRTRGGVFIRQRLLEAQRKGWLSAEAVDMAEWFIKQNPNLVDSLGISFVEKQDGVSGDYNPINRIMTLMKGSSNDETTVHEILHHLERMMPTPVQTAIRKAWFKSLSAAAKSATGTDTQKFYELLLDYHLNGNAKAIKEATRLISDGKVGYDNYQHVNPSEFWAVNGSRIMQGRYDVRDSTLGQIRLWLREFIQTVKSLLGLSSDAAVIKALNSVSKGDGKFATGQTMIQEGVAYNMFGGAKAEISDAQKGRLAEAMLNDSNGVSPRETWEQTGWYKATDGKWRFEVDDSGASFVGVLQGRDFNAIARMQETTLGEILDHDELFDLYPELRDVKFEVRPVVLDVFRGTQGWFDEKQNKLYVTPYAIDPLSTTLHEIQHWIQSKEGFENGANPRAIDLSNKAALNKARLQLVQAQTRLEAKQAEAEEAKRLKQPYVSVFDETAAASRANDMLQGVDGLLAHADELAPLYAQMATLDTEIDRLTNARAVLDKKYKEENKKVNVAKRLIDYAGQMKELRFYADKAKTAQNERGAVNDQIKTLVKKYTGGRDVAHELYRLVQGEAEARNTQARKDMEFAERAVSFPEDTMDVTAGLTLQSTGRGGAYLNVERPTQGMIAKNIAKLPKAAQQPVRNMIGEIKDVMGKRLDYMMFTSDLVKRAIEVKLPAAKKFADLIGKSKAEARENEIAVEKIADMYALVPEKDRGIGDKSVNRFLFDSTRYGKWGYDNGSFKADPEMKRRFDALSKESQEFVKAVFAHGSTVLAQKKAVVLDSARSEYDSMITLAQNAVAQATDPNAVKEANKNLASLKAEKAAMLKRFQTLFKIREGIPYAPIKRNGNYVVVAKSQAYRDAEAAGDAKKLTELESSGDHYHVSFTDSKWDGRTLQQQLVDEGAFASVDLMERDAEAGNLFGNALKQLTEMRARIDKQSAEGDKSAGKMLHLVSQMYLEALAEGSARKSEMRRRGVDGEVDMVRSFAQQGRADAHFMASVKFNPQIQDALQEMRDQKKDGDRTRKSEVFNELVKRYTQSLDYAQRPWLNKLTRLSSLYYLATSPAYYFQNLTQPWMMSVPAMAGRHDYAPASSALFNAYTELGGVVKSGKLLKQQFDFAKVPADVRDAIKELVNRGSIDIGLETEIGEFKVEGDGYIAGKISAADKALRLAVQKVESINRLSTAMAAYRLELAKTGNKQAAVDYADRILTETHGDYTSFNAPRIFNTGFGKVALQFRKFQLIQIGYYIRLINDMVQGNDRKAAFKTFVYSLSHTAVLAGAMGIPGYSLIALIASAIKGDDDEPYDMTAAIRKAIGDEAVANLILKGTPTLIGADISGKVGAGNMFSIMPFSQADLSTRAGILEAGGTIVGGASLGMTARMVDGLGLMMSGDWYRGLSQVLPKGAGDAVKGIQLYNEGMTRRNGDVVVPASEISFWEATLQGLGVSPVQVTTTYERQNAVREITTNFQERTTALKNQFAKADRNGDNDAKAEAREAWKKLQDARVRNGLDRKPLSDLLKAPAEQRKREKNTVDGVPYTKATKKLAQQYAED